MNQKISVFLLRIALGWIFFYSGLEKVLSEFTAKGFLLSLKGPFASFFLPMAGNPIVDQLVIWGELLIGIALLLGLFVRFASFWGIIMMILFYFAQYPPEHAFIIEEHIIYSLVFLLLMISQSGLYWGLDKYLEKKIPQIKPLLG